MRILAAHPFRTGSVTWQEEPDQWTLTVVCKATYALEPGVTPIAAEPEDVVEADNHWDDDPQKSLYAPSDLAPIKPSPEVIVVGSAFAARGEAPGSVVARVVVGEVDKAIQVFLAARDIGPDGVVREGVRGAQTPLRYERAARGADGQNPVGVPDAADAQGRRPLPNLQPPGAADGAAAPVGFGPIASTWPERRNRLVGRASWSDKRWPEQPLGDGFDMTFFQAAPSDQRVRELSSDEAIVLENLHPEHKRLATRLPGLVPVARVEPRDAAPWDLTLVADTLWIDTNRGLCTLTWRGQIPLHTRDQEGTIAIAAEEENRPSRKPTADDPRSSVDEGPDFSHTMVDEDAVAMAFAAPKPVLPFAGRLSPFAKPSVAAPSAPQPAPDEDERDGVTTEARIVTPRRDAAPAWLPVAAAAAVPHVAPTPNVVGAPAVLPPRPPLLHTPPPAHLPPASIQPLGWPSEPLAPPSPAPPGMRSPASLYDASTTAAGEAPPRLSPSEVAPPSVSGSSLSPRALVELVWYDPTRIGAVRKVPAWEPLLAKQPALAALTSTPPPLKDPDAESDAAEKAQRERADIQLVLGRATPTTNVEAALFDAAAEDGSLVAPLVVTAGELELGLDEVKMLEAMIGAAAAFAPGDKKLKEVVDLASEMMKTPLGASPVVAGGLVASVRDAWTRSSRLLPPDYLDVNTRRLLLEQRSYQTRGLWGDSYIRGVLFSPSNSGAGSVPTYLPAAIAKQLPLFARFPVRIVAEIFPQQDQLEASPVALRAVALGRVVQSRANR